MSRPRIIECPERMDDLVSEYVDQQKEKKKPLTLTGMIYHLGLSSRQSLDEYAERDEFSDSVKRAKLLIESQYEENLHSNAAAGSIFALKNFGWKDKIEQAHSGSLEVAKVERVIIDPNNSDS